MPALPGEVLQACKHCNVKPADLFQYRIGADDVTLLDLVGHKYRVQLERLNTATTPAPKAAPSAARKAVKILQDELVTVPHTRPPRRKTPKKRSPSGGC